ncbi:hypothetical protein P879_10066 [Paragonimus westermani]|uniref:Uncharacterized protein n=1 Tax=Paragonimus westermani TaxID=34504 RepID=A0A8T0D986_9TREM|nr:hypothetical protein P879_10066 [Paragonimus westermani]
MRLPYNDCRGKSSVITEATKHWLQTVNGKYETYHRFYQKVIRTPDISTARISKEDKSTQTACQSHLFGTVAFKENMSFRLFKEFLTTFGRFMDKVNLPSELIPKPKENVEGQEDFKNVPILTYGVLVETFETDLKRLEQCINSLHGTIGLLKIHISDQKNELDTIHLALKTKEDEAELLKSEMKNKLDVVVSEKQRLACLVSELRIEAEGRKAINEDNNRTICSIQSKLNGYEALKRVLVQYLQNPAEKFQTVKLPANDLGRCFKKLLVRHAKSQRKIKCLRQTVHLNVEEKRNAETQLVNMQTKHQELIDRVECLLEENSEQLSNIEENGMLLKNLNKVVGELETKRFNLEISCQKHEICQKKLQEEIADLGQQKIEFKYELDELKKKLSGCEEEMKNLVQYPDLNGKIYIECNMCKPCKTFKKHVPSSICPVCAHTPTVQRLYD